MFPTLEGIRKSKPNIRPSPRVILSNNSEENFIHQGQISGKCIGRLSKYPNFTIKYQNINWSRRTGAKLFQYI